MQHAAGNGNQREVWKNIKTLSGKTRARTSVVRDKTGKLITDTDKKMKRWKEYFEELLNPTLNTSTIPTLGYGDKENFFPDLPLYPPTAEELIKALPRLKNHKAAGYDEISNEEIKYGDQASISLLLPIFSKI